MALTGAAGEVPLSASALDPDHGGTSIVPIAGPLTAGTYEVDWPADGHKVSGSHGFSVVP